MRSDLLSIITVSYNQPEALARTLRSLLPLREQNIAWEQVVVDSSPEKNDAVINEFSPSLPILRICQNPQGIYSAMNEGVARSSGGLLWFLNGGDLLERATALKALLEFIARHPEDLLFQASVRLFRSGKVNRIQHPGNGIGDLVGINRVCHQSIVYRRTFFQRFGLFCKEFRLAADYELHLRAGSLGALPRSFDQVIAQFDQGGASSDFLAAMAEFAAVQKRLSAEGVLKNLDEHRSVMRQEKLRHLIILLLDLIRLGTVARSFMSFLKKGTHK